MKIVHFDEMFHPDFGYQINILPKYQAKMGHDVYIVTGDNIHKHIMFVGFGDMENLDEKDRIYEERYGVHIIRLQTTGIISGRVIFKKGYIQYVDSMEPDVLFCHFNDTVAGISFTKHIKKATYPIVFDSHMLEMASKNPLSACFRWWYKKLITPIIIKNKSVVIRTQDDPYVEKCLGIPLSQAPFISFGSDTELFKPDTNVKKKFREENNISEKDFVVVYTGKINEAKGGKLLARAFEKKFDANSNVLLVAVGNTSDEYGEEVEEIFKQSQNQIIRFPTQKYEELAKFYQASDLSVFPKQCSLSFYDAQACGLPVVSEDNNINIDRLQHDNGYSFKAEDVNDLRDKILKCANMPETDYKKMSHNAFNFVKNHYDYENIADQYTEILKAEYIKAKGTKNL